MTALDDSAFDLIVTARSAASAEVDVFDLASPSGASLPSWQPGAHIDVILPTGDARQYSLCGTPGASSWRIGVLREDGGRGGSRWIHESLAVGSTVRVAGPRNHFEFSPERGTRYVFIAGGVGITPIVSMLAAARAAKVDFELHYAGRSRSTMAFVDELVAEYPGQVHVYPADEGARIDLDALFTDLKPFTTVYCCGPARLIDAVQVAGVGRQVKSERFEPKELGEPVFAGAFEVELAFSGITVEVPPERSVLDVVEEAGVLVLSSCREGTCGTCETRVMEGEVDHRDSILTPDEQAANELMYICVSRAACPRLVLEL